MENKQHVTVARENLVRRRLYMDFDLYTEGDKEFKKELISMIVINIRDCQKALSDSFTQSRPEFFLMAAHKIKPSISMLNDPELTESLKEIGRDIIANQGFERSYEYQKVFNNICDDIVISLEYELTRS